MNINIKFIYPIGMVLLLQLLPLLYPQLQPDENNRSEISSVQMAGENREDGLIKIILKPINIVTVKF